MPSSSPDAVRIVLFQHGSHGQFEDFGTVVEELQAGLGDKVLVWGTDKCSFLGTDAGCREVAKVVTEEIDAYLEDRLAEHPGAKIELALVGHSMGGLLLRDAVARSRVITRSDRIVLAAYVSIATPHVGVRQLRWPLLWGAWLVGVLFSRSYRDLLNETDCLTQLCDDAHLAALARFRKRIAVSNVYDLLVSFNSSSLMLGDGTLPAHDDHAFGSIGVARAVELTGGVDVPPEEEIVSAFATGLDFGSRRAKKVAHQLRALRSLDWEVIAVQAPAARWRFAHTDIIATPTRRRDPEPGRPYAKFIAREIIKAFDSP
ncbi:hypothetical protein DIPPA_26553 [Diplonema papillatum]|nr:hypothetical protein DIPPA_26553 [Diplonema papillatum]